VTERDVDLKSFIEPRPLPAQVAFRQLDKRIRAQVFICIFARVVFRELEPRFPRNNRLTTASKADS